MVRISHVPEHVRPAISTMVSRIVDRLHPEMVILFGSYARGDAGPESDVDLLVVVEVAGTKRDAAVAIDRFLYPNALPVDVIVTKPSDALWRRNVIGTIEYPAFKEGRVLYDSGR